jgi:putative redox protein
MTSKVVYEGSLRTVATHTQSGTVVETDAPTDNHGMGARFSPTDLVATALANCMITLMAIKGGRHGLKLEGASCEVEKIMVADPLRRIGEIKINFRFPSELVFGEKEIDILEEAALTCPVYLSLHPETRKTVNFNWPGRP